jgi:hypothetical protein
VVLQVVTNVSEERVVSIFRVDVSQNVALGVLVVSVLATGPKVRGFKPGRERWILRVIKSANAYEHENMLVGKIQRPCFSPVFHQLRY